MLDFARVEVAMLHIQPDAVIFVVRRVSDEEGQHMPHTAEARKFFVAPFRQYLASSHELALLKFNACLSFWRPGRNTAPRQLDCATFADTAPAASHQHDLSCQAHCATLIHQFLQVARRGCCFSPRQGNGEFERRRAVDDTTPVANPAPPGSRQIHRCRLARKCSQQAETSRRIARPHSNNAGAPASGNSLTSITPRALTMRYS